MRATLLSAFVIRQVCTAANEKGVSVGNCHTCVWLHGHTVKCWGDGSFLAYGDRATRGDAPGQVGDKLYTWGARGRADLKEISAGYVHTRARRMDGSAQCWGSANASRLGDGV